MRCIAVAFFTYPLRFARPPNLEGQIRSASISSSKLGEVPGGRRGMLAFADSEGYHGATN